MRTLLIVLAFGFAAFGCGSNDSRNYTFSENGCSTQNTQLRLTGSLLPGPREHVAQ